MEKRFYIGVIGAGSCPDAVYESAMTIGTEIGKRMWTLVCGGLGGVMEAAARGCAEAGGMTIGILPGFDRKSASPYIRIPIPTGLGDGRNLLVVRASDILVSIAGGHGTLSEIALALKAKRPVIGFKTWNDIKGVQYVSSEYDVIEKIEAILTSPDYK